MKTITENLLDSFTNVESVFIVGRRWHSDSTYHTAEIYVNNEFVHKTAKTYGYGDQYLWTAAEWLREHYQVFNNDVTLGIRRYCEDNNIKFNYVGVDVARKRDL